MPNVKKLRFSAADVPPSGPGGSPRAQRARPKTCVGRPQSEKCVACMNTEMTCQKPCRKNVSKKRVEKTCQENVSKKSVEKKCVENKCNYVTQPFML
jgi:hypothetical protein